MSDPIISCSDLCIAYGRQEILHGINLKIPRGVLLPFTGANGSGKTTLLRAILGLVPIRRGTIVTPFNNRPAGYVPQHRVIDPLYPVSVKQIVEMGLYSKRRWLKPLTKKQKQSAIDALEQLGMAAHVHKNFRELSGGMKQKVLIARALVCQPDVIIMDEPTSELDEQSETEVLSHLKQLNREHGKTILMVHHDLERVKELTGIVCKVGRGKVELVTIHGGAKNA